MTADRAQSEVVGNVLLVGTAVLAVSVFGLAVVGGIGGDERTYADVDADTTVGTNRTAITHNGGDSIAAADLRVLVGVNGSTPTDRTRNDSASTGTGDGRFGPGDRWGYDLSRTVREGTVLRVVVADNATETVVADETVEAG
ncbi:MAG: type IV pilin N-terminal domain-containing protein [Haloferacaceae archaeon]